jgi:diaminopropionate ammonia-lyase
MYSLAHPLGDDAKVVSGESGAVCLGVVIHAMLEGGEEKKLLGLGESSKVLVVSTEGDTDPGMHYKIVNDDRNKVL